jgi:UDP-glucose 4-epimerase
MVAVMASAPIVAVTGGAGFIGSHTVDRLIETGHRVVVLDDFSTGSPANLARWSDRARHGFAGSEPALEVITVDISHGLFAALEPFTRRFGKVERIVHLAAQVSVVHSMANPLTDMHVNYGGTLHVLEYARTTGVEKVVFASSAAVYGNVDRVPVSEDLPTRPLSPYGIDKRASELALYCYTEVHGVATTALRFFNVFGPRQDPTSAYSGVISIFASRAQQGKPLTIFGDGGQSRDFVYVGDVARAICAAATTDRARGAAVNIGTGREITVAELARAVVAHTGGRSEIVHAPARAGEVLRSVAAVDRARDELGFTAEVRFEAGLAETLAWAETER